MTHPSIRVSILTILTIASLFKSCHLNEFHDGFLDLQLPSIDKTLFLQLVQRLTLTENVLKRTLSLVTAAKNIPFSDVQKLLRADPSINAYLSDFSDIVLPHDVNESAEPSLREYLLYYGAIR